MEKDNTKSAPSRVVYTILSAMGYFLDGYDLSVITIFTFVLVTYNIFSYSALSLSVVTGSALLGAIIGAVVFGHYADRIGRRYLYIFDLVFFGVFAVLSALSTNILEMIIFRFFVGWGIGADYALSPVYASEMYPTKLRGKGYALIYLFSSVGSIIALLIGFSIFLYNPLLSWRWALGLGAVPAIITVVLRMKMPESSRWKIIEQGDAAVNEAKKLSSETGLTNADIKAILAEKRKEEDISAGSISALFKGEYGKRTAIVWIQWILYDLNSYGFGLYAPIIVSSSLGIGGAYSLLFTASLSAFSMLGAFGAVSFNDSVGRRKLQLIGFAGMMFAMALLVSVEYYPFLLLLGILGLYVWSSLGSMGPGNTVGLYAIELLPTKLRSSSMGMATAITRFVSFIAAFEFPFVTKEFGIVGFFYALLIFMVIAFIFTLFFTPETKGLSLEQIAQYKYKIINWVPKLVPSNKRT